LVQKKIEWCGYPKVKKIEDVFIRFDIITNVTNCDNYEGRNVMISINMNFNV